MNKLKFNISALYLSLHSRIFFWDLIRNKRNSGFSYIMLLAALLAVVYASIFVRGVGEVKRTILDNIAVTSATGEVTGLTAATDEIVSAMPKMTVSGNQIKFEITEPKVIEAKDSYIPLVFDPTNKFNANKLERVLIINTNHLILKLLNNQQVIKIDDLVRLDAFKNFTDSAGVIDNNKLVMQLLNALLGFTAYIAPIMFFAGFLMNIVVMGVSYLFFAFIASMMFNMLKVQNNDFKNALRVSAYTATPVFLLDAVQLLMVRQIFGLEFLVYFTLHILYIYTAIESYRNIELSKINKIV